MIDPSRLKYAPTHEWVRLEGDIATVGISRFAVDQLTDLIMIDLPPIGKKLTEGKSFGEIESVKAVSDLYAPVSGEVVAVNQAIVSDVQRLAADPYTDGWLIKLKVDDPAQVGALLDFAAYERRISDQSH